MASLDALVFDAYGTLFDVHSVATCAETLFPGNGNALSLKWRTKQLEYTWLRSLMGQYANFNIVTEEALRHACASLHLRPTETHIATLLGQYIRLDTFPEVKGALARLKRSMRLAILSNGAPDTLGSLVQHAGVDQLFDAVISVDTVQTFKPAMRVYQLAVDQLGIPASRIGFVSSNCWDAIGARTFGFHVFWINRTGAAPDLHGPAPDQCIASLDELLTTG